MANRLGMCDVRAHFFSFWFHSIWILKSLDNSLSIRYFCFYTSPPPSQAHLCIWIGAWKNAVQIHAASALNPQNRVFIFIQSYDVLGKISNRWKLNEKKKIFAPLLLLTPVWYMIMASSKLFTLQEWERLKMQTK